MGNLHTLTTLGHVLESLTAVSRRQAWSASMEGGSSSTPTTSMQPTQHLAIPSTMVTAHCAIRGAHTSKRTSMMCSAAK